MGPRKSAALAAALMLMVGGAGAATSAGARPVSHNRAARLESVGQRVELPLFTALDGRLAATRPLHVTLELASPDGGELSALAAAVSTPGSPEYHHYISVRQFAQRFGASQSSIATVSRALRADGLSASVSGANRLFLNVNGDVGQVDAAFHTTEERVTLATGRRAFANLSAPELPASIAGLVKGVIGLDDIYPPTDAPAMRAAGPVRDLMRSPAHGFGLHGSGLRRPHVATGGAQPCSDATAASQNDGGYTIDELASAYQLSGLYGAGDQGAGQTVGILEIQPYDPTDVATYDACFGISPTITQVNVDGGPGAYNTGSDDDGESAMDIEIIAGVAPKATIDVYEAGTTDTSWVPILSAAVSADQAKVISSSIAECETAVSAAVRSSDTTLLEEAATQGQSFFDASGDSGSESCSQLGDGRTGFNENLSVMEPDNQPYATSVGATALYSSAGGSVSYDFAGTTPTESVWNNGTNTECDCGGERVSGTTGGGSGGGLSTQFAMPSYQQNAPASLGVIGANSIGTSACGQTYCREVPDVSANGDIETGYIVYFQGSAGQDSNWQPDAGTSAAAPFWAGLATLVNADSACRGTTLGFANPALYKIAASSYGTNFNDPDNPSPFSGLGNNDTLYAEGITSSDNSSSLYPTTSPGYTMGTGLGTPVGSALAQSLCSLDSPTYSVSVNNPGTQTSQTGNSLSLQINGTDSGNASLNYSASGLPAGLSISGSGLISGTPSTTGSSSVTVTARDAYTNTASTSFIWNVNSPPSATPAAATTPSRSRISGTALGGTLTGKPKLTFTVTAGSGHVRVVRLTLPAGFSLSRSARTLQRDVVVKSGSHTLKYTISSTGSTLTITMKSAATKVEVTIGGAALGETRRTQHEIKAKKLKSEKLSFAVVDGSLRTVRVAVSARV